MNWAVQLSWLFSSIKLCGMPFESELIWSHPVCVFLVVAINNKQSACSFDVRRTKQLNEHKHVSISMYFARRTFKTLDNCNLEIKLNNRWNPRRAWMQNTQKTNKRNIKASNCRLRMAARMQFHSTEGTKWKRNALMIARNFLGRPSLRHGWVFNAVFEQWHLVHFIASSACSLFGRWKRDSAVEFQCENVHTTSSAIGEIRFQSRDSPISDAMSLCAFYERKMAFDRTQRQMAFCARNEQQNCNQINGREGETNGNFVQ